MYENSELFPKLRKLEQNDEYKRCKGLSSIFRKFFNIELVTKRKIAFLNKTPC